MRRGVLLAGLLSLCAFGLLAPAVEAQSRPGTLVAITNDGPAAVPGTMLSIARNTGASSVIATLAAPGVSLSFSDDEGKLYGSFTIRDPAPARSQLVTLDPVTGAVPKNIGFIVDAGTGFRRIVAGMGFAADGTLYGVEALTRSLVTIGTATAEAPSVGSGLGVVVLNYGALSPTGCFTC